MLMTVLEKTTYTATTLPANQLITYPVALNIPASDYEFAVVVLRVHDFVGSAGAEVIAAVHNSAPSTVDPGKVFRVAAPIAQASLAWSATVAPGLAVQGSVAGATTSVGEALDVLVTIKQGTVAQNLTVTISMDLVLKRA